MKTRLLSLCFSLLMVNLASAQVIFDFEVGGTSSEFQYFGSALEPGATTIIDNPNATGVNTSSKVTSYIKAAGAMTWAGAFALNAPTVDATLGGQICIDVHMDHLGTFGLKLEASPNNAGDWITVQSNTVTNEWETICFNLSDAGLEDAMNPAAGNVYGQMVVFPDFGTAGGDVDVTTFFDNITLITGGGPTESDVTFSVNMGEKTDFGTVFLSGEFNEWSENANPMTDSDGDNVWETTITVLGGAYEYKFQLDAWTQQENFDGSDVCTTTFDDGNGNVFTNRLILVTETTTLPTVCYESCYNCDESVNITWNLNMQNQTVSDLGVYVAGGEFFGHAELPTMTDDDGDGVYTITLEREIGFTTDYTFLNGICLPDWGCKENISGQDCAVGQFNDRNIAPVMEDTEINTCFGECSTDGSCGAAAETYNVTFRVDMNDAAVGTDGMFLAGDAINSWSADATPMEDNNGDGIYEVTVELESQIIEFKFVNSGAFEDIALDDCTVADPSGQFINRVLLLEALDTILPPYLFESCALSTVNTTDLVFENDLFKLNPSISTISTKVVWKDLEERTIAVYSLGGQLVDRIQVGSNTLAYDLDLTSYASGLYVIKMTTESKIGTQKLIVGNN